MVRQEMSVELNCLRTRMSSQPEDDFSCFIMPFQGIYSLFPQFMLFDVSSLTLARRCRPTPLYPLYITLPDALRIALLYQLFSRAIIDSSSPTSLSRRLGDLTFMEIVYIKLAARKYAEIFSIFFLFFHNTFLCLQSFFLRHSTPSELIKLLFFFFRLIPFLLDGNKFHEIIQAEENRRTYCSEKSSKEEK